MYEKRNSPPIKEGDEVNVRIESIGDKGDGVARVSGFVIFVPDVKVGENVRVKVKKVLSSVSFGEVIGRHEAPAAKDAKMDTAKEAKPEEELVIDESKMTEDFGEDLKE